MPLRHPRPSCTQRKRQQASTTAHAVLGITHALRHKNVNSKSRLKSKPQKEKDGQQGDETTEGEAGAAHISMKLTTDACKDAMSHDAGDHIGHCSVELHVLEYLQRLIH